MDHWSIRLAIIGVGLCSVVLIAACTVVYLATGSVPAGIAAVACACIACLLGIAGWHLRKRGNGEDKP